MGVGPFYTWVLVINDDVMVVAEISGEVKDLELFTRFSVGIGNKISNRSVIST